MILHGQPLGINIKVTTWLDQMFYKQLSRIYEYECEQLEYLKRNFYEKSEQKNIKMTLNSQDSPTAKFT
jgi:hypothetical protein